MRADEDGMGAPGQRGALRRRRSRGKSLLGKDLGSTMVIPLFDNDEDDAAARRNGIATTTVGEDKAIGNACGVIIIAVVASACWHLLAFSKQQQKGRGANDKMFSLGRHQRDLEQVILLYRNGRDACSFGTFCRIGHFRKEGDGSLGRHASQI